MCKNIYYLNVNIKFRWKHKIRLLSMREGSVKSGNVNLHKKSIKQIFQIGRVLHKIFPRSKFNWIYFSCWNKNLKQTQNCSQWTRYSHHLMCLLKKWEFALNKTKLIHRTATLIGQNVLWGWQIQKISCIID